MHGQPPALKHGLTSINWRRLQVIGSVGIIVIAIIMLALKVNDLKTGDVLTAITEIPRKNIGLAALCVFCAFCTLTFYDLFALRTIGKKHVPYRIAALSSFTSYAIGHNVGFTVFTGGAIRFRIYSDYGLNAIDVAKVVFLSGLTFWLGNVFILSIAMLFRPAAASAADFLPELVNQVIAMAGLAAILAYLVWLSTGSTRRELGQNGWKVVLPSAPLTIVQILIGVVDLGFCATAMFLLMPASPSIDLLSLSVVFILATLLGFASHVPGSLAVLDTFMLNGLPQFNREQLVATIVMFRILYFIIPFAIAISIMGTRELWINVVEPWQQRRRLALGCVPEDDPSTQVPEMEQPLRQAKSSSRSR